MKQPRYITSWESIDDLVVFHGEYVSLRLLYEQHERLRKELWIKFYQESFDYCGNDERAKEYAEKRIKSLLAGG